MMTSENQRVAWVEVHKALNNYLVDFGPIELKKGNKIITIDCENLFYIGCGKLLLEK